MKLKTCNEIKNILIFIIFSLAPQYSLSTQPTDFNLPNLGDSSASVLSPIEEKLLGKRIMRQAKSYFRYVSDPEIENYINSLGKRLLANSDLPNDEFNFYLIDDKNINAFAVPGGHISLNTGLIAATNTESQFAGVVAHEITHITQRHLPRMIARAKELNLPTAVAIIGGILLGGQVGAAAIVASNANLAENQLSYTRDFEREADALGIKILVNSNFDANGMPEFFEILQNKSRLLSTNIPEFLRTHPLTVNRISESQLRAQKYKRTKIESSSDYFYMREKIRALAKNHNVPALVDNYQARLKQSNEANRRYILYGYAYALAEFKNYDKAKSIAYDLKQDESNYAYINNLIAQIEAAAGNYKKAISIMDKVTKKLSDNTALKTDYADILLKAGEPKKAHDLLRKLIQKDKTNPYLYRLFARANGEIGNSYESHRALAEYHYHQFNYKRALDHLYQARNNAGDSFHDQASVEARIKEVQSEKSIFEAQ